MGYLSGEVRTEVLCGHICDLESENAKLRELISEPIKCDSCEAMLDCDECLRADVSHKRVRSLKAENAKLRWLVEDMLDCIEIRESFGMPPTSEMCEEFAQRARELGIEVDG